MSRRAPTIRIGDSERQAATTLVMDEAKQLGRCLERWIECVGQADTLGMRIYGSHDFGGAVERHAEALILALRIARPVEPRRLCTPDR